jgi:DNA-binding transcriptional MerR regulator
MNVRILTLFDEEPMMPTESSVAKKSAAVEKRTTTPKEPGLSHAKIQKPVVKTNSTNTEDSDKNYYTIGETAQKFKVRTSHIRFWTVQFGMKVRTTRKGDRLYTPENIEQLKVIHHLVKEQGFTIAGAKSKLKELKGKNLKDLQKDNILGTLKNLHATLISLKSQIDLL